MGKQQWVDVPLPRTLNLDTHPANLEPDESPNLLNMVTYEPGQIRQRKHFTRVASITSLSAAGDLPCSAVTSPTIITGSSANSITPTRALVTVLTTQSGVTIPYRDAYPGGPTPTGYTEIATGDILGVFVNADNPASVTTAAATAHFSGSNLSFPFGQQAQADFSSFYTSIGRFLGVTKTGANYTGTHLMRWAGSNRAFANISANATNGSTAVTVTGNPTPSLAGTFMRFSGAGATTADPVGKQYNYYVLAHTAGTNAVTLSKPFGLGDVTIPNHAGLADQASFIQIANVVNAPPDIQGVAAYLGRIFVGRPTVLTAVGAIMPRPYPNAVAWSDPNEPEKWTDTNIAILDNNPGDPVMGFGVLPTALVIFRRYSTWTMTGTDEANFTFRPVRAVGCIDCRSITQYRDGVFFMSDTGLYYYNGYDFENVTSPKPGRGIRTAYVSTTERFAYPETYPLSIGATTLFPRTEHLLMIGQDLEAASTARHDGYAFHIPSATWTRFNTANTDQIVGFMSLNNTTLGFVGSEGIVNLDVMYQPEFDGTVDGGFNRYDESYNVSTGANTSIAVRSTVQFPDLRLFDGGEGYLHEVIVEHDIWKVTQTAINGPDVTVSADPYYGTSLVSGQSIAAGNVTPRYFAAETAAVYTHKFSTRLNGTTWPIRGSEFRVTFTTEGVTLHASEASFPPKYLGLRMLVEPTMEFLIDNPVTS